MRFCILVKVSAHYNVSSYVITSAGNVHRFGNDITERMQKVLNKNVLEDIILYGSLSINAKRNFSYLGRYLDVCVFVELLLLLINPRNTWLTISSEPLQHFIAKDFPPSKPNNIH